ncbi:DUF922 domain-containing protein [Hymenobacter rubripertinctus]|uniref:DUF922 domain-containing protein n=1 Tax=Hymenobacter rubripertinctus TaxID=2029981 RepID=A0A418QZ77_9BACT|nr:DUF922 domain-containing protein [Hymenobacter rubripertinctus]RIY10449.1 DUF922 domain-containing protein [Hymenobacter rubripertinctus]
MSLPFAPIWLLSLFFPVTNPSVAQVTPPAPKLEWHADRLLTWDDFKARPNTDRLEALTSSTIDATIGCIDYAFSGQVRAVFTPSESWVRNAARATPALLRHEQVHFDLTEVHARLLRQKLTLIKFDCLHLQPAFNNLTKVAFLTWQRDEAKYDQETNHGLNAPKQQEWDQKTQQRLQALAAYAK